MRIRIRHDDRLRLDGVVRRAAGLRDQRGRGVRGDHGPDREHDLPLPDLRDERGRHEQRRLTKPSKRCPNAPTVETKAASAIAQTTATLNATVNPNGGEVSECKFEYGTTTAYGSTRPCAALPGSGHESRRRVRRDHRPDRQHDLPLQDLGDECGRHEQRLRRNVQNAIEPADGRDESGLGDRPDHGNPERHRQPQRRGSERMQARIRHDDCLRLERTVRRPRRARGPAPSRCPRRSPASPPTRPTTSGSSRPTRRARARG